MEFLDDGFGELARPGLPADIRRAAVYGFDGRRKRSIQPHAILVERGYGRATAVPWN